MHILAGKQKLPLGRLYGLFFAIRVAYALLQSTYFVPDEHWQGPEVAHALVFGRGYFTWEWQVGLRSYMHPFVIGILYKLLEISRLDFTPMVVWGPRVLQAAVAAVGDTALHRVSTKMHTKPWATIFHLTNWFSIFTYSRTVVNSTEVSLVLLGVLFFVEKRFISLALIAGLSFAIRPTSALFFIPICLSVATTAKPEVTAKCVTAGLAVIVVSAMIDFALYGAFVIPALNFFKYNISMGIAEEYGIHNWHFFFTVGMGSYFLGAVPIVLRNARKLPKAVLAGCLLYVGVLSLSAHKELRFAAPVFAVLSLVINARPKLMFIHYAVALFFSRFQGAGPDPLMHKLREISGLSSEPFSFLYLGCHGSPWTTHVHDRANVNLDFLECAPRKVTGKTMSDRDEFGSDPVQWLQRNSARIRQQHAIAFDGNDAVEAQLQRLGFHVEARFWDGLFGDSSTKDWEFQGYKYLVLMTKP